MRLQKLWDLFEQEIFPFDSSDLLWNPYSGENSELDISEAAKIRRQNLKNYLESYTKMPEALLVGEAPGPWGCRFSGIAFTSERQLVNGELPFHGKTTSTFDPPVLERSGTILWGNLLDYFPRFFVWNCIPYHPTNPNEPLSIRTPKKSEIVEFNPILKGMVDILSPKKVVAIGRKAEQGLSQIGLNPIYVRHPSFGGKPAFIKGMAEIFNS
ncbi:MAG: uracil-DNA glycosylase [Chloroflexi bacterium]|jgi:hypothetical protein|nr:uracil-DNA glycosylase [Chloroflexota bacterium]MBT3669921.1 uracil-DNA glycosylase [Chloroflexota bacterium]MBT4001807.1 uracil-DNA glycosylase [Chloroflexota bacterium]MBT4304823.1 uracil-DNA glycosylase [Chloroflexota bacterium]MBT4534676.1 uracil-DNA glycosylase [Chloroflexota bacterium]